MMARGCIGACVLPLRCFLFFLPNYTNILVVFFYLHYLVMSLKYSSLNSNTSCCSLSEGSNICIVPIGLVTWGDEIKYNLCKLVAEFWRHITNAKWILALFWRTTYHLSFPSIGGGGGGIQNIKHVKKSLLNWSVILADRTHCFRFDHQ